MKVKRRKKAERVLTFFHYHFGFSPPYSVLLDGTFCQAALQNQINLREQMPKYLSGEVLLCTTKCVLNELEELGGELHGALCVARQFSIAKCPHNASRTATDCLKRMARRSKKHEKYLIGTQDNTLLESLREIAGIPLLSIRFNTILLEKPSPASVAASEKEKLEIEKVRELKAEILGEPKKRNRKGPKAPNPLSCKKKQPKQSLITQDGATTNATMSEGENIPTAKRKRTRKRKRINSASDPPEKPMKESRTE